MKKALLLVSLLVIIIYACNQTGKTSNRLLNSSRLSSQLFSVDITKDTTLLTQKGAVIKIPKGALSTNGTSVVQLEIKEAYSIQDIIMAGLTTQSNGHPLSSGGMIYINAVGENTIKITQAISVATPTPSINPGMQLYKGEIKNDSSINWIDPKPLPSNPQQAALDEGKEMFTDLCSSCHAIGKDLTGPDLAHSIKRMQGSAPVDSTSRYYHNPVYDFTISPSHSIKHDPYYRCLFNKWNKTVMTEFPELTYEDLDKLYGYIENESDNKKLPIPNNGIRECVDSCELYMTVVDNLQKIKKQLEEDSVEMVTRKTESPIPGNIPTLPPSATPPDLTKVVPSQGKSLYYQFTIETFGWYNIDMLYKIGNESELLVRIVGQYRERFSIYFVLPEYKVMLAGGPAKGEKDLYAFDNADGTINLPQDARAYIIAMGEYEDKIIFVSRQFTTQKSQQLDIELAIVTEEFMQKKIRAIGFADAAISVTNTKNADELRKVIRELKNAEQLKPVNCDCNCFLPDQPDSPGKYESTIIPAK